MPQSVRELLELPSGGKFRIGRATRRDSSDTVSRTRADTRCRSGAAAGTEVVLLGRARPMRRWRGSPQADDPAECSPPGGIPVAKACAACHGSAAPFVVLARSAWGSTIFCYVDARRKIAEAARTDPVLEATSRRPYPRPRLPAHAGEISGELDKSKGGSDHTAASYVFPTLAQSKITFLRSDFW